MNRAHVLPVADILRDCFLLEYVFDFYEDGLRGLLRDHVLVSSAIVCDVWTEDFDEESDPLERKITDLYQGHLGYRNEAFHGLEQARLNRALVSSREIRLAVNRMMHQIFQSDVYTIDVNSHRWLGNDLVVKIDLWG